MCKRDVQVDAHALQALTQYLTAHPEVRQHEAAASGLDPLNFPNTFMQYEILTEPEHANVLAEVKKHKGKLNAQAMNLWIASTDQQRLQNWPYDGRLRPGTINGGKITLTGPARQAVLSVMTQVPLIREHEIKEHGLDPYLYPEEWWRSEITTEREHADVLQHVAAQQGQTQLQDVQRWQAEEAVQQAAKLQKHHAGAKQHAY